MMKKINSEFYFSKKATHLDIEIGLSVIIDYEKKTYDIYQEHQEGIMPSHNNKETLFNKAYFELALEALEFIEKELYKN